MAYDSGWAIGKLVLGLAVFSVGIYFAVSRGGAAAIGWGGVAGIGLIVAIVEALKLFVHVKEKKISRV